MTEILTPGLLEPPPHWVRDYFEGLDFEAQRRQEIELAQALPGIGTIFQGLIESLPDPNAGDSEFPVAAAVVRLGSDGRAEVVSRARNKVNERNDSTQHAETVVLQDAQRVLGKHLRDCTLLTTMCTCIQCTGVAINTEVKRVVIGIPHEDVKDTHARVGGQYKPYRTNPPGLNVVELMRSSGIQVIENYQRRSVLSKLRRVHGGWSTYYTDLDSGKQQ